MKPKTKATTLIFLTAIPIIYYSYSYFISGIFTKGDEFWVVGGLLGLIGYLFLWWQYILGIRPIVRFFTPDLFSFNDVHKNLGIYGYVLISLHPLLLLIDAKIKNFFIPLLYIDNEYNRLITLGTVSLVLVTIIWLTSKFIRNSFNFRDWKRIHYLSYLILPMVYLHSVQLGVFLLNPPLRLYWDILFGIFLLTIVFRLLFQFGLLRAKYKVKEVKSLTHNSIEVLLQPVERKINPRPGQFVYLQIGSLGESHPYTVAHYNVESGEIALGIKDLGWMSGKMRDLDAEEIVYLDGAYGVFTKEIYETNSPLVLLAGGIGITPFIRLFDEIKKNPKKFNQEIYLFYGSQSEDDIIFREEVDGLSNIYPKFKVIHVLSNVKSENPEMEFGFITSDLLKKYLNHFLNNYKFFICGPPVMVEKLTKTLREEKIPYNKIYVEKFSL